MVATMAWYRNGMYLHEYRLVIHLSSSSVDICYPLGRKPSSLLEMPRPSRNRTQFCRVEHRWGAEIDCYCPDMSKRGTLVACTAVALLTAIGAGSVSADESVPVPTTTTVVEQYDEESGLIWSQVDDQTIEVSFPD
jgi:hypothetical protein